MRIHVVSAVETIACTRGNDVAKRVIFEMVEVIESPIPRFAIMLNPRISAPSFLTHPALRRHSFHF